VSGPARSHWQGRRDGLPINPELAAARASSPRSPRPAERRASAAAASIALDRHLVERFGPYGLLRCAWDQVESDDFVDGWHLEELSEHLRALYLCRIRDLVNCQSPATTKSLLSFVVFPVWCWIQDPSFRVLTSSNDVNVALRDAGKSKTLISSEWFRRRWGDAAPAGPRVVLDRDEEDPDRRSRARRRGARAPDRPDATGIYYTTENGLRYSTSVGGKGVGWHFDLVSMDDGIKPDEADSAATLDNAWTWWTKTAGGRARDRSKFRRFVQGQRLSKGDPPGRAIERGYTALVLPNEYEPHRRCVTPVGGDRRTVAGELLCPARITREETERLKADDPETYRAQFQQDPQSSGSRVWRAEWFRRRHARLPEAGDLVVCTWDLRTKGEDDVSDAEGGTKPSFVAGSRWRLLPDGQLCWEAEARGRWGIKTTLDEVERLAEHGGRHADVVLVENKANGSSVVALLEGRVRGALVLYEPQGSKRARGRAAAPHISGWDARAEQRDPRTGRVLVEARDAVRGCVSFPADGSGDEFLAEVVEYPAEPNDRGDGLAQLVLWSRSPEAEYHRALSALGRR
jgi:hypothetical protein